MIFSLLTLPGQDLGAQEQALACCRHSCPEGQFCNAPYARVVRAFFLLVQWFGEGAVSPAGTCWRHTGSIEMAALIANPLGFLAFRACAAADSLIP